MILETVLIIKDVSKQKENEKGEKYFSVLVEVIKKDWDFGEKKDDLKISTSLDLTQLKGKRVKSKVELYITKKNEISMKLVEVIP